LRNIDKKQLLCFVNHDLCPDIKRQKLITYKLQQQRNYPACVLPDEKQQNFRLAGHVLYHVKFDGKEITCTPSFAKHNLYLVLKQTNGKSEDNS